MCLNLFFLKEDNENLVGHDEKVDIKLWLE
jgi:hypothetical protein